MVDYNIRCIKRVRIGSCLYKTDGIIIDIKAHTTTSGILAKRLKNRGTVEIIIITNNEKKETQSQKKSSLKGFYGAYPAIGDGMEIQKKLRSEWDD